MTAEEEEGASESRCFLVGLQMDGNGRDLLTWVLDKAAKKGDLILAVHVCRKSDDRKKSMSSLIKSFNGFLEVFNSLCGLKQIMLVGHVVGGNSIKKTIVKEAEQCSAAAVVVGVNKNCPFGGTSLAKYCAKKLPKWMSLFAVDNGKIVLGREGDDSPPGGDRKATLGSLLHPSVGMRPNVIIPCIKDLHTSETPEMSIASEMKSIKDGFSSDRSLLAGDFSSNCLTTPGWPLRRRGIADNEARKMSVVQWVMRLPSRSSTTVTKGLCKELEFLFATKSCSCKLFRTEELRRVTNQFSAERLIGKGGNSQVYIGRLPDGQEVAIKLSKLSAEASRDFILEADIITSLSHKGVVPLIGACLEDRHLMTVYKFFSNGSLEQNLHGKRENLPWDIRFKIAIGIAEALNYLHNDCPKPVIHRDIKSSNILLSDEFEPQLSDFGLSIWAPKSSSYLTDSDVVGTFGYLAPEYFMYGKVSIKIDVYAFGVLLLEMLTGRKPISNEMPKGQESLVMWAAPMLEKGNFVDILDPKLDTKYDEEQMKRMMVTASLCIKRAACLRPQMNQVVSLLKGEIELDAWIKSQAANSAKGLDCQDEETHTVPSFGSHLGLALGDVDDDASVASFEQNSLVSWEEYLRGRWSRSSSFD